MIIIEMLEDYSWLIILCVIVRTNNYCASTSRDDSAQLVYYIYIYIYIAVA